MLRVIIALALSVASALTSSGAGESPTSRFNNTTNSTSFACNHPTNARQAFGWLCFVV
jgi:hypothetical protein